MKTMKTRKHKGLKILAAMLTLAVFFAVLWYFAPWEGLQTSYTAEELGIPVILSEADGDGDGVDDHTDLLEGARSYVQTKPKYQSDYYQGGYPPEGIGVCTDVIWQAFAAAGYDLKTLVDQDIAENPKAYPQIDTADPNIDFRRVPNLKVYFERTARSLTLDTAAADQWQAGDIVVFSHHIAICSDRRNSEGVPYLLHHTGRGAREADDMARYRMIGHYRWN